MVRKGLSSAWRDRAAFTKLLLALCVASSSRASVMVWKMRTESRMSNSVYQRIRDLQCFPTEQCLRQSLRLDVLVRFLNST